MLSITKLKDDFSTYYAPNLLKVRDEQSRIVPFILRPEQLVLDSIFTNAIKQRRTFIYILKARQDGISTWSEGRLFHRTHMYSNTQTAIMAHEAPASDNIFLMTKRYYDHLPREWQPLVKHSNRKELSFENPAKSGNWGLKSRIRVFTAGTPDSAHSFTFNCIHLSEFSRYAEGSDIIKAVEAGIPEYPGNFCIMETTGNGVGNYAYDLWNSYSETYKRRGENSPFITFFLPWYQIGKYSMNFPSDQDRLEFDSILTSDEKVIQKKYSLTLEQLNWRRTKIESYGGDMNSFMEAYPAEPEEAFISTGKPVFDASKIRLADLTVEPSLFVGEISYEGKLSTLPTGRLTLWHFPEPTKDYILGVDPKGDSDDEKSDECTIQILDRDTLCQVGEWAGMVEPIALAPVARALGKFFGTPKSNHSAQIVVERNSSGLSVLYELQKDYWNTYKLERFDGMRVKQTDKLGWETNVRTKPMLIDFGTFCFHNDYSKINSKKLLGEMRKFVRNVNSAEAEGNSQDNRVMAWLIALFVAGKSREAFSSASPSTFIPIITKPTLASILGDHHGVDIDMDEVNYDEFEAPPNRSHSEGWMSVY